MEEPTTSVPPPSTTIGVQSSVPWLDAPYDPAHPPPVPGTVADPAVPWCSSGDLVAGWPPRSPGTPSSILQGATGSLAGPFLVTNESSRKCALQGAPAVSVLGADGRVLTTSSQAPDENFVLEPWTELDPGTSAYAGLQWFEYCQPPDGPYRIAGQLPHSGGTLTEEVGSSSPRCDGGNGPGTITTSNFTSWAARGTTPPPYPTPLSDLGFITIAPPAGLSATPGGTVSYEVEAINAPDNPPVTLSPCPAYRETLRSAAVVVDSETYLLNCASHPTIQPGETVKYVMRIQVPAGLPPGTQLELHWEDFFGVGAESDITVMVK